MNYQSLSKEKLIAALNDLEQKYSNLKLSCEKKTISDPSIVYTGKLEQFELFFNTNPDAALITRLSDGLVAEVNDGFTKLTGFSREEIIGSSSIAMKLWKNSEDRNLVVKELLEKGFCENFEAIFERKTGSSLIGSISAKTIMLHGVLHIFSIVRDITEQKKAEEALRESEEKFRSLYTNMNEGSALHTLVYNDEGVPVDYLIVEVNPAFEAQLGISSEKVKNKPSKAAYGVETPPYFDIYSRVALTGIPEVFETYFAPLDKYFSISAYCPVKGSFATIFENITERKKAEQSLRVILTKYQVLFDTFPIGITITDPTGKIIESNKIAESLLGISYSEQEKRTIDGQEWRIIRPDGTSMPSSEFASVRAMEENRAVTDVEMGIVKGTNQITWLNVSAIPVPIEGYGVAILYSDMTERRQAENENEKTKRLLEDSQRIGKIGGWEITIDTRELKWTREMYNIHEVDLTFIPGVDKRANFYTPESLTAVDNAVQHAIENGEPYELDSEIITAKGNRKSVKAIGRADMENRRVFGFFQDITERKIAEEALKKSEAQLKELNATKDKFFSIIAHDLKSPFSSILGFSGILKDEARNLDINSIVKYTDIINSSAQHTFRLLENLLDWARMQQGGFHFEPKKVLINNLIETEIEGLKYNADQKKISLINKTNEAIIITADEKMLGTVIRNLVSNAIKFTPTEGLISIDVKKITDQVEVTVSDSGVGLPKETIEKLFKIETNFTTRGTDNEKGSGLGLLLCKEFVEKHGGRIRVESELRKGSKFIFSIPS